ncbi:hypothetical protein NQ315_003471 [Exocentrus adspersus]|uniref:Uncharacterized protein n=1 Tax=Exocentrus adspersus TaxID=1586481 RepID=A0AAV8VAK6_9CUCU|nr:hypothetical protein NQ315_003471 [Exocentrus adspersus]
MEDIVIVAGKRTPICKAVKGSLSDVTLDKILYLSIKGTLESVKMDSNLIEECVFGNVLADLGGTIEARAAMLAAGISHTVPVMTINRQCASGLEAVSLIASKIRQKKIQIGLAGGFESMSTKSLNTNVKLDEEILLNEEARKCLLRMGDTSEILSEKYNIKRKDADYFASESQIKANHAVKMNLFADEIVSFQKNGRMVMEDEGVRETTLEKLATLKPVFKPNGISTAGNSSQLSDASACVILTTRKKALKLGLEIQAVFVDYSVVGCDPQVMGIGPSLAIPKLLHSNNLKISDVDVFEINEAFASQALYCVEKLGIKESKVNLFGGAIALGHPLGCTGTRLLITLINVMKKNDFKNGVISLCVGTGMGVAALIKRD